MHSLEKTPPSSLLVMGRFAGSDKQVNYNIICRIKADNGHGPVAHSARMPPYSTQLLISKLEIMIVLSINLNALIESSHITINQKDCVFGHVLTMVPWQIISIIHRTSNICFASCPSMNARLPLLLETLTHLSQIQTMLSWPNLSTYIGTMTSNAELVGIFLARFWASSYIEWVLCVVGLQLPTVHMMWHMNFLCIWKLNTLCCYLIQKNLKWQSYP